MISIREIAKRLDITTRHCERIIADLKSQGRVQRTGLRRAGKWIVVD